MNRSTFDNAMARFSVAQRDSLFEAVLAHDDIYDDPCLPDVIPLARNSDELADAFFIVAKLFLDLESMARARAFLDAMVLDPHRGAAEVQTLKHPRARFKHTQFTMHLCDARHRYPRLLHGVTVLMGEIQDALKHDKHPRAILLGHCARRALGHAGQNWIVRELRSFQTSSHDAYRGHLRRQTEFLAPFLGKDRVTAQAFHATRKVISRLMAHYDNLTLLDPTSARVATARFISTLNGLMGGYHDELVAQKVAGTLNYHKDSFIIPTHHRLMLEQLLVGFRAVTG